MSEVHTALPQSGPNAFAGVALLGILFAGLAILPRVFPKNEAPIVGHPAPSFELTPMVNPLSSASDGVAIGPEGLRGSVVILDFWATWCPPCREEAPILDALSRRWRERGLVVVGVDTDTADQGDPKAFALSHHLSYAIVHDESGRVSRSYGVESLPTLVVISRTGTVVAVRTGLTDDADLESLVRKAVSGS